MPDFLKGLFQTKGLSQNATPRALSSRLTQGGYNLVHSGYGNWDIEQTISQGYDRVIWVYRCIDAIASNASSVPIVVREFDDVDGKIIEDSVVNKLLNRRPNKYETAQQFRYRLASQLLMSRAGAFIEVVYGRGGRPVELHILPPTSVKPIADANSYVSGYAVRSATEGEVILPPERVIWIRVKPHPTDPYAQTTPMVSAGLAADTDFLARLFNRNFLSNDGRPGMLVGVRGQLSREDAEEIRRRFSGGPLSAGATTVIESDGIDVQDMSTSPRDAMYLEAIAGSKADILLAFGVPESVLGNAAGRTFDNADAEFEIFWTTTMLPFMDALAAGFDVLTSGGIDDEYFVAHDYSKVDVLQRRSRERHDKALGEYNAGLLTIDQYLELVGRKPFDVAGTKVLWLPAGKIPVGLDDSTTDEAQALQQVGMGAPIPGNPSESARAGAIQGITEAQREIANIQSSRALAIAGKSVMPPLEETPQTGEKTIQIQELKAVSHPYEGDRSATETEIGAVISAWSRRQERAILERIGSAKVRQGTRHWEGEGSGTKAIRGSYVVDVNKWAEELLSDLDEVLQPVAKRYAQRIARELQKAGVVDAMLASGEGNPSGRSALDRITGGGALAEESVIGYPISVAKDMIRESAMRQSDKIIQMITEMDADGASLEEIKREVRKKIGSRSSWKRGLSTAVTTAVVEGSRNAVLNQCGRFVMRKWVTIKDERTRPSHWKASGQKREGGKKFRLGNTYLMYPGDPTAPIEETANCRCWVEFSIVKQTRKPVSRKKELVHD